eukprot:PITA_10446
MYHIVLEGKLLIIVLYVDDLILTFDEKLIKSCKEDLGREFEMKDMGLMHYFVGTEFGLWYRQTKGVKLQGFANADWAGSPSNTKSTSRGIFSIGSATIYGYNRKQISVALSLAKAEYMAASQATCEAIWMRKILVGLFGQQMDLKFIYYDNKSCIKLSKNPLFHDRSKHIDIWYHHLRDRVLRQIMLLDYIPTEEQDADILTKALSRCKFKFHRDRIGVVDNPFVVEREC